MSIPLSYRFQLSTQGLHWQPIDSAWRTAASEWLVAHDLFHHQAEDCGTLGQELASLGAEYFICYQGKALLPEFGGPADSVCTPGEVALVNSAAGIVGMVFENCCDMPAGFHLSRPALASSAQSLIAPEALAVFAKAAESAASMMEELSPAIAPGTPGVVLDWVMSGYLWAQETYPDQAAAHAGFESMISELHQVRAIAKPGDILQVKREGDRGRLRIESPGLVL